MTSAGTTHTHESVASELARARHRTLELLAPVPDADQRRAVSPLMSPLCWDLAHIGHYEELWLLRALTDAPPTDPTYDDLYDAFKHPRRERPTLPILGPDDARAFVADVRARVLDVLDTVDFATDDALRADAFVYGMVIQHEHQHDETVLATIQLMGEDFEHPAAHPVPPPAAAATEERTVIDADARCLVPGGAAMIGAGTDHWAYDNERSAHTVELAPFALDRYPVTNRRFADFVADGGYRDARLWSETGWAWRTDAGLAHPQFWDDEGNGTWSRLRFGRREDLPPDEPVQHVGYHEADAFTRWAGGRLPSELEWEAAAAGTPPGAANLGQLRFGPSPIGSRPACVSRWGCEQMLGDVWEWTSSDFAAYPGFVAFPYPEYSEVFFGPEYKVLRGGSWATDPVAVRTTFRNWDFPIRRQIFSGLRCAHDV